MKTTVDIPEELYKKAKIRAVETGQSLKAILISSLEHELEHSPKVKEDKPPYWGNRKLTPEYKKLMDSGALGGGTDSTIIISEDRSSRENSIR